MLTAFWPALLPIGIFNPYDLLCKNMALQCALSVLSLELYLYVAAYFFFKVNRVSLCFLLAHHRRSMPSVLRPDEVSANKPAVKVCAKEKPVHPGMQCHSLCQYFFNLGYLLTCYLVYRIRFVKTPVWY